MKDLREAIRKMTTPGKRDRQLFRDLGGADGEREALRKLDRLNRERAHFLESVAFGRVLIAMDGSGVADKAEKAIKLIEFLRRIIYGRRLMMEFDAVKIAYREGFAEHFEQSRARALDPLIELRKSAAPKYHDRLDGLLEEMSEDLGSIIFDIGHLWAADFQKDRIGKRGSAGDRPSAWRGLLVRELDSQLPNKVDRRCATIAALLRLAGDSTIKRQDVRSILQNSKQRVAAK